MATAPASATDHAETGRSTSGSPLGLLPAEYIVDASNGTAPHLVGSAAAGIDLIALVIEDQSWQARQQTGYAEAQFTIDWDARLAGQALVGPG